MKKTMSDKDDDDAFRNDDCNSGSVCIGRGNLRGTKKQKVDLGMTINDDRETNMDGVVAKDPFLEVFNNGLIVENILIFLDSKEIASKRRVAKLWNPLGLKVLKSPLHGKKAFKTNDELRNAVLQYCHGQRRYNYGENTTAKHQFEVKCEYGFVIGKWDVSQVQNFSLIFFGMVEFNEPFEWDTSNATTMHGMFYGACKFNSSLGPNFCTANVKDMGAMFSGCSVFDQPDISKFDTSNVERMEGMFADARSFNQPLNMFKTSRVVNMDSMLYGARCFNQTLEALDTSNVKDMVGMLYLTPLAQQLQNDPKHMLVNNWGWNLSKLSHTIEKVFSKFN